ncbi:hypothetical protein J7E71_19000 [Mesobacillus foraminis]|uniref:hypothetical protein n=1 Tax=Mesobacillus foraminis TaxID=279826 RepID=UPI001BE8A97D|nr:hypothetical protein [Mesobacillus foraminis]MBT2757963.1 hypothetical protein [Mesobacillus foraminis]
MPVVTLLEHLKHSQKKFTLLAGPITLNDIQIDDYIIDESYTLLLFTSDDSEVQVSLGDFVKVDFDAIANEAKNKFQMRRCLAKLATSGSYNAYVRDSEGSIILSFCGI